MRSILVYADRSDASSARLQTALSLARAMDGHVSVLVDTPIARFMAMDAMGGSYLAADAVKEAVDRDDDFARELADHLRGEDAPFDIARGEEEPVDALAEASRLNDVVVLSRDCEFAGQVAVSGRGPVLVTNPGEVAVAPFDVVMVAWDGSYEAAHALRLAVPLLQLSGAVHVVCVGEKTRAFPSVEALEYLSRHGVTAQLVNVERVGSVEESLAAAAARLQAGLVVMGAYGHSRLREFLMGGVTDYFLSLEGGPVLLLAH
jgi:nucleotide-binding universal stress UspA family protein